jgi:hypothetical protein
MKLEMKKVHTELAKVKGKFMIKVMMMLKLNLQMEEEKPRSRGDANQQASRLQKSFVHIESLISHFGTGARSVWQDVPRTGLIFNEVRRSLSKFRRCAWTTVSSEKRPGRNTPWCWSARTGRRS